MQCNVKCKVNIYKKELMLFFFLLIIQRKNNTIDWVAIWWSKFSGFNFDFWHQQLHFWLNRLWILGILNEWMNIRIQWIQCYVVHHKNVRRIMKVKKWTTCRAKWSQMRRATIENDLLLKCYNMNTWTPGDRKRIWN